MLPMSLDWSVTYVSGLNPLYYQDTLGGWHLTKFSPKPGKIECKFVGAVKRVPNEVEPLGTVLTP